MNRVILMGRLTKDPEIREGVASYTLAVERNKDEADYIKCVCFKNTAEFAKNWLHKGMKVAVEGRLRTGSYTDKNGNKVFTTDVVIDRHEFCERRGEVTNESVNVPDNIMDIPDNIQEELPFK